MTSDQYKMKSILDKITVNFKSALKNIIPKNMDPVDPMLRLATEKKFGDYQSNVAMSLAKKLNKSPRDVAQSIVDQLQLNDICSKIEIAGPGFINLHINNDYLSRFLTELKNDVRLGVAKTSEPIHHVIDFSSPNLAKEMHVGHLRTTITGEVIARVIEFMGHSIERVNHVGDWGTQFGMLLQHIYESAPEVVSHPEKFAVKDLEVFYKEAKSRFDSDQKFAEQARLKVVLLQSGDETSNNLWKAFRSESLRHCHEIYKLLDIQLKDVGESFYNNRLPAIVEELEKDGFAMEDGGAVCVFLEGFLNRDGDPLPMIIKKSDGGYCYATTDLAALKYRIEELKAKRLIYVTDNRQDKHFEMLFALARKAGWAVDDVQLDHIGYGMVLGADRKPFKTREGGTVRLKDLIDEGIERARFMIDKGREGDQLERVSNFSDEKKDNISRAVGLAAIKYCDLSHNLASDYVFSWDKMLAMDGNTGPYMLYTYARIMSIGRKGGVNFEKVPADWKVHLEHDSEIELAKLLVRFGDIVHDVSQSLKPNLLTDYLYSLSKAFSTFYDFQTGVQILNADTEQQKYSRLLLCQITARILKQGLHLLGINVVEEM